MALPSFTSEDFIWVRVVVSGDDCNLYACDRNSRTLRLFGVHRVETPRPVDLAVVTDSAPDDEDELPVLLLSHRAIPPDCLVSMRPLGLLTIHCKAQVQEVIVAVPGADDGLAAWREVSDLPEDQRVTVATLARTLYGGREDSALIWADAARAREVIHQRKQAARLAQARSPKGAPAMPAWKPLGYRALGARRAAEIEPHSDAEYAYHQLPARFQEYVNNYLTHTERILFAVRRPALRSAVQRSFLRKSLLQEGLLMITDQQVVLACEIMPPDLTGIRYGYVIQGGVPERIASATVRTGSDRAFLEIAWQASAGDQTTTWEFPAAAEEELTEAAVLLRAWRPMPEDTRLRRAYGPPQAEVRWQDPTAAAPASVELLAARLTQALHTALAHDEPALATALLPAWATHDKQTRGFVVTDRRVFWLADPAGGDRPRLASYAIGEIASLEFQSSVIESWLAFYVMRPTGPQRVAITFPYAAEGFQECYSALRQQLVAVQPVL